MTTTVTTCKKTVFGLTAVATGSCAVKIGSEAIRTALAYKTYCYERVNPYGVASFVTDKQFLMKHLIDYVPTNCMSQLTCIIASSAVTCGLGYVAYKSIRAYRATTSVAPIQTKKSLYDFLPPNWEKGGLPLKNPQPTSRLHPWLFA